MPDRLRDHGPAKPKFTGHRRRTGGISLGYQAIGAERHYNWIVVCPRGPVQQTAIGGMMKKVLVSVVEDDRFLRESMCRLMRSLGYTVDIFSSAADFLASARLAETACLIADIHMPVMTGLELYRHLIDTGNAIPT